MSSILEIRSPRAGPGTPNRFSYSLLASLEECPRRWWLQHAQYPGIDGPYPLPNSAAAIRGTVVHRALEAFARHLEIAGLPAPGTEAFDAVRRSFNVRSVIRQLRDEELDAQSSRGKQLQPSDLPLEDCLDAFRLLVSQGYAPVPANTHLPAKHPAPVRTPDLAEQPTGK